MTLNLEKLQATLPTLTRIDWTRNDEGDLDMVELQVAPYSFIRDGMLFVSVEHGDDAGDYYGEFRGGYAWINPKLEAWAKEHKSYWEWQDGGTIVLAN